MTAEQWKEIEKKLVYVGSTVKLRVDGYDISLQVQHGDNRLKNIIAIYVNGFIKGEWLKEDCEICKKFYWHRKKCYINKNELKKLSKKRQKNLIDEFTYTYSSPYFEAFSTLKSHFIKNNKSIELQTEAKDD